jgi:hypothetical protein
MSIDKRASPFASGIVAIDRGSRETEVVTIQIAGPKSRLHFGQWGSFLDVAKRLETQQVLDGFGGKPIHRI